MGFGIEKMCHVLNVKRERETTEGIKLLNLKNIRKFLGK